MDHVNNAVYADWLEEAVLEAGDGRATPRDPAAGTPRIRRDRPSGRAVDGGRLADARRLVVPPAGRGRPGAAPCPPRAGHVPASRASSAY